MVSGAGLDARIKTGGESSTRTSRNRDRMGRGTGGCGLQRTGRVGGIVSPNASLTQDEPGTSTSSCWDKLQN